MKILGIETSCDETSAAIIEADKGNKKIKLLSNVIASSVILHASTGGIIPEIAAREQIKFIIPVIDKSLQDAKISYTDNIPDIHALAVTIGPGLIGSLLIGVETAKALSYTWNKPIIPVNHLIGHIYANWIDNQRNILFPALALIVSGGHTDLVLLKNHSDIQWISGTRDDAAGEAFDKIGRLLGLSYPAGPLIETLALNGNPKIFYFPRPLLYKNTLDFSFSGLKTAAWREINKIQKIDEQTLSNLARATQDAIIEVLVKKTFLAAKKYNVASILLSGGVAANQTLTKNFQNIITKEQLPYQLFVPLKQLCTDNAAMIATAGFFHYQEMPWEKINANPELYFD